MLSSRNVIKFLMVTAVNIANLLFFLNYLYVQNVYNIIYLLCSNITASLFC